MASQNISFNLGASIDELQDELDENYLLARKISSLHDPIDKLDALLSEINKMYHKLMLLMITTCDSFFVGVYACGAYHKKFKDHVFEWFGAVFRLRYRVLVTV